jgi:hypothetical protein
MVISTSQLLRGSTAFFSLIACIFASVTIYATASAVLVSGRTLRPGDYTWLGIMLRADPQRVRLEYDWSTEICIWVAAGSSVLAGFFGAARVGMQERERRRRRVVDDWVCYQALLSCGSRVLTCCSIRLPFRQPPGYFLLRRLSLLQLPLLSGWSVRYMFDSTVMPFRGILVIWSWASSTMLYSSAPANLHFAISRLIS